jgi:hypothetical protein
MITKEKHVCFSFVIMPRCQCFQDAMMPCDSRQPGPGCQATEPGAQTRNMAILGALAVLRRSVAITLAKLPRPE